MRYGVALQLLLWAALSCQGGDFTNGLGDLTFYGTFVGSLVVPATNESQGIYVIGSPRGEPGSEYNSENYFVSIGDAGCPGNPGISLNGWINQNAGHEFDALPNLPYGCYSLGIDTPYGIHLAGGTYPLTHWANLTEWWPTNTLYPNGWEDIKFTAGYQGYGGPTLTLANITPNNSTPLINLDMLDTPEGSCTNDVVVRYSVVGVPEVLMFGVTSNVLGGAPGTFFPCFRIWADRHVSFDAAVDGSTLMAGSVPSQAIASVDASQVQGLYESPETTLTRGTITIPHNLGHVPHLVRGVLRCTQSDPKSGVNAGEEVPFESCSRGGALTIVSSPTQFRIQSAVDPRHPSTLFFTPRGNSAVSAVAHFKIVIYAFP